MNQWTAEALQTKVNEVILESHRKLQGQYLEKVMSTVEGRRFIFGIMQSTNFQGEITVDNASKRDYLLGRRSVSVDIYRQIKSPENAQILYPLYEKMIHEDIALAEQEEAEKKRLVEKFQKGV